MDLLDKIIAGFSNTSDPMVAYAISGVGMILTIMFFRKVLFIIMILIGLAVVYLVFSHFTGFKLPIDGLQNISLESLFSDIKAAIDSLMGNSAAAPAKEAADTVTP